MRIAPTLEQVGGCVYTQTPWRPGWDGLLRTTKGLGFYPVYSSSSSTGQVSWMLAKDTGLLGQRQKAIFRAKWHQQSPTSLGQQGRARPDGLTGRNHTLPLALSLHTGPQPGLALLCKDTRPSSRLFAAQTSSQTDPRVSCQNAETGDHGDLSPAGGSLHLLLLSAGEITFSEYLVNPFP